MLAGVSQCLVDLDRTPSRNDLSKFLFGVAAFWDSAADGG